MNIYEFAEKLEKETRFTSEQHSLMSEIFFSSAKHAERGMSMEDIIACLLHVLRIDEELLRATKEASD